MNRLRVGGILTIIPFIFIILISIPPIPNQSSVVSDSTEEQLLDKEITNLFTNSVVETDYVFTESNDALLVQFLDSQDVDSPISTERLTIEVQTALFDSDGNQFNNSTFLGVPQLSVTDEQGRLLDLGLVQLSLRSVSKNIESNTNIWGKINFYLDDTLVGSKYIWGSQTNTDKVNLSLVDNLTFDSTGKNSDIASQISPLQSKLNIIGTASSSQLREFANSLNIPSDSTREQIEAELRKEINFLSTQYTSEIKRAYPPSFSQQEKKTFTFTFADEGLNWIHGQEHVFRAVITDIHADLDSDNSFKKFNFIGQKVAYELRMTVDDTKKVIIGDTNKAVEIIKSDGELHMCTGRIYVCAFCGYSQYIREATFISNVPPVTVYNSDKSSVIIKGVHDSSSSTDTSNCSVFKGIPRNTDIIFSVEGVDYPVKTPLSQKNYLIIGKLDNAGNTRFDEFIGNRHTIGGYTVYVDRDYSNFGYGLKLTD